MNQIKSHSKLHNPYFSTFIPALLFTLLCLGTCLRLSLISGFAPANFNSLDDIDTYYSNGTKYVECSASKLYYSGYDYVAGNKVRGHYYYSLENEKCTVYLLSAKYIKNHSQSYADFSSQSETSAAEFPIELENITFKASLKKNDTNLKPLLEYMAADLNWNYNSLSQHTCSTLISQYNYSFKILMFILIITLSGLFTTVISAVLTIKHTKHKSGRYKA